MDGKAKQKCGTARPRYELALRRRRSGVLERFRSLATLQAPDGGALGPFGGEGILVAVQLTPTGADSSDIQHGLYCEA